MAVKPRRKPRRNAEAIELWIEHIGTEEVGPWYTVNSIHLEGDTIEHYGWWPMAKIVRDKDGSVTEVYVNSTQYSGATGFGESTNGLQSGIAYTIRTRYPHIPVILAPLTNSNVVRVTPVDGDDEPVIPALDIPVCPRKDVPFNPGVEPVKSPEGCIAGTTTEYEYADYRTVFEWAEPGPQAFITLRDHYGDGKLRRVEHSAGVKRTYFGEGSYSYHEKVPAGHDYKQCPHCAEFDRIHSVWHALMNGGYYNGPNGWGKIRMGWKQYVANVDRFGSPDEWRAARSALMALRKQRTAEHAEWFARNSMPYDMMPTERRGNVSVPIVNADGMVERAVFEKVERERLRAYRSMRRRICREERERKAEEKRKAAARAEMRARFEAGDFDGADLVDPTIIEWMADEGVEMVEPGVARLFKRVHKHSNGTLYSRSGIGLFEYKVGEWAIAEDYRPSNECGHGLHFAGSVATTDTHYGPVVIECHVPIASLINMQYKVKGERCYVARIVNN
jgi:hypothetical protein